MKTLEEAATALLQVIDEGPPAGATPENQQFPDGFDEWPEEKRNKWFDYTAHATYIAQCHYDDAFTEAIGDLRESLHPKESPHD